VITFSKLELVDRCPGSITLPWIDEPNEYSDAGNARHEADEADIQAGIIPEVYDQAFPGLNWRSEVSYAYDTSDGTARELGVGIKRAYGDLRPFEIAGTLDVEGRRPGVLVVIDRKSYEAVTPPAQNLQVRSCALAAARARPADRVVVGINHELTGLQTAELDPVFDLDVIAHDVRALLVRSAATRAAARAGQPVEFRTGRWCRWCPAFHSCPEQAKLKTIDPNDANTALSLVIDDESAPRVYQLYQRIGILQKRLAQAIHAYAASTPIPLGGGRFFGRHETRGNEKLNGDAVWEAVKELYPGAEDDTVVRSATKKRLEEALKGRRGAVGKVLELVRERGGATRSGGSKIEEYEAKPRLVAAESDEE
jgi:hypothetical protein